MEINNLIIIPLLESMIISSSQQVQENKSIVYTSEDLMCLRDNVYHDHHYRILSAQTCKSIRSLRIKHEKENEKRIKSWSQIQKHRTA